MMMKKAFIFYLLLFLFFSCRKKENLNFLPTTTPTYLIKIIDSIQTTSQENRTLYNYTASGLVNKIIYNNQYGFVMPPAWGNYEYRIEYNSQDLPVKTFAKNNNDSERLYSVIEYDLIGRKVRETYGNGSVFYTFTYDANGRCIADTQYRRVGTFEAIDFYYIYRYDTRGNVVEMKTIDPNWYSTDIVWFKYDSAVNPFNRIRHYHLYNFGAEPKSLNNITSMFNPVNGTIIENRVYEYNSENLPVRAVINYGSSQPLIRTFFYN